MSVCCISEYKLIIFDWDGTLMDSIGRIVSSMQNAAIHSEVVIPSKEQVKDIIGLSLPTAIATLFPEQHNDKLSQLMAQYKYQYVEGDSTPAPLFDDVHTLLSALGENNKLLAVATGKGRQGLQRVFKATKTEHFFHASRCADEAMSKPHPDMLHSLLLELNVAPKDAVMIGDSKLDLQMAQSAGIDSIGITLGVHDETILRQFNPKAIVDSITQLHSLLLPL